MKNIILFGIIAAGILAVLVWRFGSFHQTNTISAQSTDTEHQKLLNRDRDIPPEKVEKAFAEAKRIKDDVLEVVSKKMTGFELQRTSDGHIKYGNGPGRRGETSTELAWEKGKTRLNFEFSLGFNKEDALTSFRKSMAGIAMGEFIPMKDIGDEAILVKNVLHNKEMTDVAMHFVAGRATVHIFVSNHERKTDQNEKELMKVVALIRPLINARPSFDDD